MHYQAKTRDTVPQIPKYESTIHQVDDSHHEDMSQQLMEKIRLLQQQYTLRCGAEKQQVTEICIAINRELQIWKDRHSALLRDVKISEVSGSEEEGEDADWVMDSFLSRLSATISKSIRQVVVPGSPLFSTPYTDKIVYHFFQISGHNVSIFYQLYHQLLTIYTEL